MANVKRLTLDYSATALTVYAIIRREVDSYRLDDATGSFAASPANPYVSLTEDSVIKGRYEKNESRQVWNDGRYTVAFYQQAGGSPAPVSDTIIGSGELEIQADREITEYWTGSRLFSLIESQRGTHTGKENIYYWNPITGNDSNDGLTHESAKLTWAGVNALVTAYSHDIIIIIPGNASGQTVITEKITLDKAYTLLRGPGRDIKFKPTTTGASTIIISAAGCELSGFIAETHTTGSADAIEVNADFTLIRHIDCDYSRGHAIKITNAGHAKIHDIIIQDAAVGGSGRGILIHGQSATLLAHRNEIWNLTIQSCQNHGIEFRGLYCTDNYIYAGDRGTKIHDTIGWGVTETDSADDNHLIGPLLNFSMNTLGDVNLTGVNSTVTNISQWAKASDYTSARAVKLDNLDAAITSRPTLAGIEASTVLAKQVKLDFVEKWILNKLVESPSGTWTLYDTDDVSVLKQWVWTAGTSTRSKAT